MKRPATPSVDWDSVRFPNGDDVSIVFVDGDPEHSVRISREALEDGLRSSNKSTQANLFENRKAVELAIANAFRRGEWEELVEIYSKRRVYHPWVHASDSPA